MVNKKTQKSGLCIGTATHYNEHPPKWDLAAAPQLATKARTVLSIRSRVQYQESTLPDRMQPALSLTQGNSDC